MFIFLQYFQCLFLHFIFSHNFFGRTAHHSALGDEHINGLFVEIFRQAFKGVFSKPAVCAEISGMDDTFPLGFYNEHKRVIRRMIHPYRRYRKIIDGKHLFIANVDPAAVIAQNVKGRLNSLRFSDVLFMARRCCIIR